jgi:hypothetical protein
MTPAQRVDLRRKINAGELASVRFRARVFGDEPNMNRTRPEPGNLQSLADQARGRSFIYDHWPSMDSKKGRLLGGLVQPNEGGVEQLYLDHEVTEQGAMLDAVEGRLGEFSISIRSDEWVCSGCGAPEDTGWFGPLLSCDCDEGKVELFAKPPLALMHNAAVTEGAYRDTGFADAYSLANRRGGKYRGCGPANEVNMPTKKSKDEAEEGRTEDSAHEAMADASNLPTDDVVAIIDGADEGVTSEVLAAFATALEADEDALVTAAEADGIELAMEEETEDSEEPEETEFSEEEEDPPANPTSAEFSAVMKRLRKAEAALFEAEFRAAVTDRRLSLAQRPSMEAFYKATGDIDATIAHMRTFEPVEALSGKRQSSGSDTGAGRGKAKGAKGNGAANPWAMVDYAVSTGAMNKETASRLRAEIEKRGKG